MRFYSMQGGRLVKDGAAEGRKYRRQPWVRFSIFLLHLALALIHSRQGGAEGGLTSSIYSVLGVLHLLE
jgi:hypothetical protein